MWRRAWSGAAARRPFHSSSRLGKTASKPVINIDNGTFYKQYPSPDHPPSSNPSLLRDLNFLLPSNTTGNVQNWSIVSPSSLARTIFLQILAGQHICIPPHSRTYPYLSEISQSPQHAIKYVGFDAERGSSVGGTSVRGAYLSARYESRREETDFSVRDYLMGQTELNPLESTESDADRHALEEVVDRLNLRGLLSMPVANLSNGQTRRARIAKALMARPEVLLLDGPFMGLDPRTLRTLSGVLSELAERQQPRLVMSLRPEDGVPEWVSHLVVIDERMRIVGHGPKQNLKSASGAQSVTLQGLLKTVEHSEKATSPEQVSRDGFEAYSPGQRGGDALVQMQGVKVTYGDKVVLGDWEQQLGTESHPGLWWSLHRGQRAGIFGPNGSGKTTMLSLITSDHPQTYSLPVKIFGRSRLPSPGEPGISVFDIQRRMGHSSPEVHAFFPKQLTVRRAIESAFADAPLAKPKLDKKANRRVDAFIRWFARELSPWQHQPTSIEMLTAASESKTPLSTNPDALKEIWKEATVDDLDIVWATDLRFAELSFSNQRLVLFIRALVSSPDLVILDEALSGIDERTRDKALLFLSQGEMVSRVEDGVAKQSPIAKLEMETYEGLSDQQALLVISHAKEDVPGCVRDWICLPEPGEGKPPKSGKLSGPLELNPHGWDEIWAGR
ncbi:P-loop containing nucleoside triphosphate hydrolase protein [Hortaea werneckii]|nr:P-loop containing nucleoside triphosphate hydrolase protein [Hortaea werneckii]KAI7107354.1 P-loop containing nucleoside triphosphate hydrolase protein [Hortaea werneckii]KAI7236803.1 P-loop containing nucleoside triphosphate hydrolase protein [Hortaea werneckii]KAI7338027.1 P-loop containing nucleoside triphosphate hydrolase protein [Hortaea werneckii]